MNSQTLIASLGWTLVHFLWQGFVVAALHAVLLRLLRHAASPHRYLAGCVALLLMLVAPAVTLRHVAAQYSAAPPANVEFVDAPIRLSADSIQAPLKARQLSRAKTAASASSLAERLEALFPWLVLGWSLGVFALSCRLLGGWLQIERLKRTAVTALDKIWHDKAAELSQRLGVSKPVRLWQSALVEVPTVIGWLRPVILLPASCLVGLTPAQLESILAHELAHIRRHDYLVNLLQSVVETVLFYHPAVWWVSRRVREERENCCDDLAVEVCGDRVGYARALATLEELRLAPAPFALGAAGSPLLPRIRRLVGKTPGNLSRPVWPLAGMMALVLMALLAFGLRGNRAVAEENINPATNASTSAALKPYQSGISNGPVHSPATNSATSKNTLPGRGRQGILAKLKNIQVDSLQFDHAPLTEVIIKLSAVATAQSADHIGINFYIDRAVPASTGAPRIDPHTGLPVVPFDTNWVEATTVTINPAQKQLTLADALEVITKTADHPIRYAVLDYAVVFSPKDPDEVKLETRKFRVDPTAFKQAVFGFSPVPAGNVSNYPATPGVGFSSSSTSAERPMVNSTNESAALAKQFRQFLSTAGADMDTNDPANAGKAFVYNDRKGVLLIRATAEDLDKVEGAIQKLLYVPPADKTTNSLSTNVVVVASKNEAALETRTFQVDPKVFQQALERYPSAPEGVSSPSTRDILPSGGAESSDIVYQSTNDGATTTNKSWPLAKQLRSFFADAGVSFGTNYPSFVYKDRKGILFIRATAEDLDKVEGALQKMLYHATPQVNLKVKFIEFDATHLTSAENLLPLLKNLDYDKAAPEPTIITNRSTNGSTINIYRRRVTSSIVSQVNGILSEEEFAKTIVKLEQMKGVDELNGPEVTTESGRQAQILAGTIQPVATGLATSSDNHGKAKYEFQFESLPFGPIADLVPYVSADDRTVQLTVIANVTEFLGYGDPTHPTTEPPQNSLLAGKQPQPIFRLRQMMTNAVVPDAQTLVLAGLETERVGRSTNSVLGGLFHPTATTKSRKILLVFITPTMINADGTRFHPDKQAAGAAADLKENAKPPLPNSKD